MSIRGISSQFDMTRFHSYFDTRSHILFPRVEPWKSTSRNYFLDRDLLCTAHVSTLARRYLISRRQRYRLDFDLLCQISAFNLVPQLAVFLGISSLLPSQKKTLATCRRTLASSLPRRCCYREDRLVPSLSTQTTKPIHIRYSLLKYRILHPLC